MTTPQKYIFDEGFASGAQLIDPVADLTAEYEEKLIQAKSESFEEGRIAGEQAAQKKLQAQTKEALEKLSQEVLKIESEYKKLEMRLEAQAIEFGITAGTKLAGEMLKREPVAALEQFFKEAFSILQSTPEVRAKLHPSVIELATSEHRKWAAEANWNGNITFVEDETLSPTDASINWDDGGVSRSVEDLMGAIQTALTNHFANQNTDAFKEALDSQSGDQAADQPNATIQTTETIEKSEQAS